MSIAAAETDPADAVFLTEQQIMVRDTAARVARDVVQPTAATRDKSKEWPGRELEAMAEAGLMGMMVEEEYGGSRIDFLSYCLALEEISAVDCGVGTIFHVHNMSLYPITKFGTESQKAQFLPRATRGQAIGCWLLTEPHAGSDTSAIKTTAKRDGDAFILNGTKQFISNGSEAGVGLALAVTDRNAGKNGVTAFIIDPSQPGYMVTRVEDKLGQHTAHTAQIQLDNYRVPAENILGELGGGYRIAMSGLADGRIAVAAQAVGVARAALAAATTYAQERKAYGKPIMDLQAVAFRLAEMTASVNVARQYYIHAARMLDAGQPCFNEASIAKLFATEMAEKVCSDALQTLGGYGYLADFPIERYCRDVRVCKIYEGTSDIQKVIIAKSLTR